MMAPVRFGVVSTAKIAQDWVIPALLKSHETEVVAISSRQIDQAKAVAKRFSIAKAYGSLEALVSDPNVDAVYIPTPNNCHVDNAVVAVLAGKHVLCEKPLAMNALEAEKLVAVQAQTGLQVSEAFMVRYHPRWVAAREIVQSGRLGDVTQIHATYSVLNENPDDIRFDPELGGGSLGDVGVYPITAARFLFADEPFAATARFQMDKPDGVDVAVAGMLEFPNNRNLLFSGALRQAWAHWIIVTGTKGWIEIPISVWPDPTVETVIRLRGQSVLSDENVETLKFPPTNQYEHQVATFARAVRGEIEQPWPISNALAGMRVLDAIRQSAKIGARVTF